MGFIIGPDRYGSLTHSGGTITLAASRLTIGPQQYDTGSINIALSGLSSATLYYVYAVIESGLVALKVDTSPLGPSGFLAWNKLGWFITSATSTDFGGWLFTQDEGLRKVILEVVDNGNASLGSGGDVIVQYDTVLTDTHGAYDTTTGRFTAPIDNDYGFLAAVRPSGADVTFMEMNAYKGGSKYRTEVLSSGDFNDSATINTKITNVNKGELLDVRFDHGTGSAETTNGNPDYNYLVIESVKLGHSEIMSSNEL